MVSVPECLERISVVLQSFANLHGPPPASKTIINHLPTITINQTDDDAKQECSICIDRFVAHDLAKKLPCSHIFHSSCIEPWLTLHKTCPVCRRPADEAKVSTSCQSPVQTVLA